MRKQAIARQLDFEDVAADEEALQNLEDMARANLPIIPPKMAKRPRSFSRKKRAPKRYKKAKRAVKRVKPAQMSKLASKIRRFSDFPVRSNTLMTAGMPDAAVIRTADNGDIVVRHREYIQDIYPTDAFTVQCNLAINPGMETLFPWLSGVAQNYENYDLKGLVFEVKSKSSDAVLSAAASTALGTVTMATQYNVLDDPFTSKRQLLNYQYANSEKPSVSFTHPVECKRNPMQMLWVRTANTDLTDSDRRLYDLGDFVLATEGCQGAQAPITDGGVIGELWCTIEVVLSKSKLRFQGATDIFYNATTVAIATPFGADASRVSGYKNNVGGSFNGTTDEYTFPRGSVGRYLLTYEVRGTAAAITAAGGFTATNVTESPDVFGMPLTANEVTWVPVTGETSTRWMTQAFINLNPFAGDTVIGINAGNTLPTNITLMTFTVTRAADVLDEDPYVAG